MGLYNQLLTWTIRYWGAISLVLLLVITALSLLPLPELPKVPGSDKTHHFVAYGLLILPAALRLPQYFLWVALGFGVWSGAIELLQPYVNRYGEWLDLICNIGGLICGFLLARLLIIIKENSS